MATSIEDLKNITSFPDISQFLNDLTGRQPDVEEYENGRRNYLLQGFVNLFQYYEWYCRKYT